jgi:pimeloyl-ACP methyl ester carboxylesterase
MSARCVATAAGTMLALLIGSAGAAQPDGFDLRHAGDEPYLVRCDEAPKRLVVYLHTWSTDYQQVRTFPEFRQIAGACIVAPNFGGPNNTRQALGSKESSRRIARVIERARAETGVRDTDILAASGGTMAAMLYLGRYPGQVRRAFLWVPIYDLAALYGATADESLRKDMLQVLGRPPGAGEDPLFAARSPSAVLGKARGPMAVTINVGTRDTTTPPGQGRQAAAALARLPGVRVRLLEHDIGHEFPAADAVRQLMERGQDR